MKYLPASLAVVVGCCVIGFATYITKNENCLWALILVAWIVGEMMPKGSE